MDNCLAHVWTVAWMDSDYNEPTITVFSNWEAASKYYHWCKNKGYNHLCMDECPVYNQIIISGSDDIGVGLIPQKASNEVNYVTTSL